MYQVTLTSCSGSGKTYDSNRSTCSRLGDASCATPGFCVAQGIFVGETPTLPGAG